jgi:hypothetical protein
VVALLPSLIVGLADFSELQADHRVEFESVCCASVASMSAVIEEPDPGDLDHLPAGVAVVSQLGALGSENLLESAPK